MEPIEKQVERLRINLSARGADVMVLASVIEVLLEELPEEQRAEVLRRTALRAADACAQPLPATPNEGSDLRAFPFLGSLFRG